jgi:hypothetical protein
MKRAGSTGVVLMGVWLVLTGLTLVINLHFTGLPMLQGILALVAGILILIGR